MTVIRRLRQILAATLVGPLASLLAHAIGDSGGCGDIGRHPLGKALRAGTPHDVDAAILQKVDRDAPRLKLGYSRKQAILNLIESSYKNKKPPPCAPNAPLLYYALDAGNVEVVRHLVGTPLGVAPSVPPNILLNCNTRWYSPSESPAARRRAYAALLERQAADVRSTPNLLAVCKEPELVSLFLEHGARPDVDVEQVSDRINYLEMAISDALQFEEDSYTARSLHALERIKLFSQYMPASIEGRPFQSRMRGACSRMIGGQPWNPRTCKALQSLVRGAPSSNDPEK